MTDTSSFGRVIDALVAIPAQAAYTALFTGTVVWDGPWPEATRPEKLVMVGYLDSSEAPTAGTQSPVTFGPGGSGRRAEDYNVPCKITQWTGDSGAGAQKTVRDAVLAQFAVFEQTIATNGALNGLITPPQSGQPISTWIESTTYAMTDPDEPTGRTFAVDFMVHVQNSLNA